MLTLDVQVCLFAFKPRIFLFTTFLLLCIHPLYNTETFNYIKIKMGIGKCASVPK